MTTYEKRNLKLLRESVPPGLENYQAMYDKEQRPTEKKSVRPIANIKAVEHYDFQLECSDCSGTPARTT